MKSGLIRFVAGLALAACASGCWRSKPDNGVTDRMREACPMLSEEVLEGFVQAVSGLRDNGLSFDDALEQWVAGCENIPADGNFQGDVEACEACLPIIVEDVYLTD